MLPAAYAWLEPVIWGAIVVFIVDLIGNVLSFSNRFVNALVTAIVSWQWLGETTTMVEMVGMAIVAAGMMSAIRSSARSAAPVTASRALARDGVRD